MKKYQPERTDLLINTEWGKPKEEIPTEEAQQQGLVLFKDRWVTADEEKELKRQIFTYRALRAVALLFALVAGYMVYALVVNITRKAPTGALVMLGIVAFAYIATAVGLYVFKRWAYYVAMVLLLIGILQSFMARRIILAVIVALLVVFLIRKRVRRVFSPPKSEAGPPQ